MLSCFCFCAIFSADVNVAVEFIIAISACFKGFAFVGHIVSKSSVTGSCRDSFFILPFTVGGDSYPSVFVWL